MKAICAGIGTLAIAVALSTPAMAQGRGNPPSTPPGHSTSAQNPPDKPTTTTPPVPLTVPPSLAAKLQLLLPKGTEVAGASTGFKNLGQFVAAVHVSKNLDIPFATLKAKLTGTNPISLGQAIQDLKPGADSAAEVKKAQGEAKADQSGKG